MSQTIFNGNNNLAVRGQPTEQQRAIYRKLAADLKRYIETSTDQGQWYICTHIGGAARALGIATDKDELRKRFMRDLGLSGVRRQSLPFLAQFGAEVQSHLEFAGRPLTTASANQQRRALLLDLASKRKERIQNARWYANASYRVWSYGEG